MFFFFNDTATTEIYTLSLHDALPISLRRDAQGHVPERQLSRQRADHGEQLRAPRHRDRKSTRLNSSHGYISYAVFCLKKKKKTKVSATNYLNITQVTAPTHAETVLNS